MKTWYVPLSHKQMRRGIEQCDENVTRLLRNADRALQNGEWAAAVYQSILTMEEQGRLVVLYIAYIDGITIDKEFWRIMFRDHVMKIAYLAVAFFVEKQKKKWRRTLKKFGKEYQELKERSMYVSFDSASRRWIHPGRIGEKKAKKVFNTAVEYVLVSRQLMSDE